MAYNSLPELSKYSTAIMKILSESGGSITFGDEEDIKVDTDGGISFGAKMAKAIKEAANETSQKGEVDES